MRALIYLLLLSSTIAHAQSSAITSAGESCSSHGKMVNWTIGSIITGSSQTDKYRIYSGDIQPNYQIFYTQEGTLIELDCFPNPATEYINLELHTNEYEGMAWKLYNSAGRKMKNGKMPSNKLEIYVNELSVGTYLLNIYDSNNKLISGAKLIKK